jgi:two-component system osmolarity sensor histidine kinase EnvZ
MARFGPPATLFGRTAATIAVAFLAFLIFSMVAGMAYVVLPMAKRSADDLAALMVLSAQTWAELPPETRPDFERELGINHQLKLAPADYELSKADSYLPYLGYLEDGLSHRLGQPIVVKMTNEDDGRWFWADIPMGGWYLRVGFPEDRIGIRPPLAAALIVGAGGLLAIITALVLVRRITRPLALLSSAAVSVGKGREHALLPETGPSELAALARTFNHMSREVQELLANRTTLLAGISHDLRTPIARMRLAVAMLPENADPGLLANLERDLEEMNRLIGEFLEMSRALEQEKKEELDVAALASELVADSRRDGAVVEWTAPPRCICPAGPVALRRILANLLQNAVRYGEGKPVTMECEAQPNSVRLSVLDRGPGIPADQVEAVFQPFYRLEGSRSTVTGGSGLGLAIAKQLADANGWHIELLSRPGGGTEARLILGCQPDHSDGRYSSIPAE